MTSWGDITAQPAKDDLDALTKLGFDWAQHLLKKHGEFFPLTTVSDEKLTWTH
jgi:hypothetical protein